MFGSHSKLKLADSCLFAFKKHYIDKIKETKNKAGRIGLAFHRFAYLYGKNCINKGVESDISVISGLVRKAVYRGDFTGELMGSDIYPDVLKLAQQFGETHLFNPDMIISLEEKFPNDWDPDNNKWPDCNIGDHTFVGIIDRLELADDPGTVIIHDYKTSWSVDSQPKVEKNPQLKRYAWLVKEEYPQFNNFIIRLDYVRHNIIREAEIGIEEVKDVEGEIIAALNQLENIDEYEATPGPYCSFCSYSNLCPAVSNDQQIIINNKEKAKEVASEILLLEKRLRDRKKALKQFCVTANVVVGEEEFGHFKSKSISIKDIEEFKARLDSMDMDTNDYLYVKTRKLKSLIKSEDIKEELDDLLIDKSYTSFRHRKLKED